MSKTLGEKITTWLLIWLHFVCAAFHVNPQFAKAVMAAESGNACHEYRWGRLGNSPFWGPGIRGRYHHGLDAASPWQSITLCVRALQGKNYRRVLQRYYGPGMPAHYYKAVMAKMRQEMRE